MMKISMVRMISIIKMEVTQLIRVKKILQRRKRKLQKRC
jgi:hypothetical protein